jgi:hypothetical protein
MANPKTSKKEDPYLKYTKYKWEFLRRDPQYIKAWGKLYTDPDLEQDKWQSRNFNLTAKESNFCTKWGIILPLPPEVSYEQFVSMIKNVSFDKYRMFRQLVFEFGEKPISILSKWTPVAYHRVVNYQEHNIPVVKTLKLKIDLSCTKSKLLDEFQALLNKWIRRHKESLKIQPSQKVKKTKNKYRFSNFDDYLKVYDLRQKQMSWAKITKELKLNNIQAARNYYKAANELIKEGISLYVK